MKIDAHLHLWDRSLGVHDWIGPHLGGIDDDFPPERAQPLLAAERIDAAILVQAADDARDTDYLLDAAARHSWVRGVVGWVDIERPDLVATSLAAYGGREKLCGIRQLVHDDPRADVLAQPAVRTTARLLAEVGLALDVPDAFPAQGPRWRGSWVGP